MKLLYRAFFLSVIITVLCSDLSLSAKELNNDIEQLDFANGLLERKFFDMAVDEYQKLISQYPQSSLLGDAQFGIAEAYFLKEQYNEAKSTLEDYFGKFPEKRNVNISLLRYGQSLYFLKLYDQALSQLLQINKAEMDSKVSSAYFFYTALCFKELGRLKEAIGQFRRGIEVEEQNLYVAQSYLEIGMIYAQREKYEQASLSYEKALKLGKTDNVKSLALFKQGEINFIAGKYTLAIKKFERILEEFKKEEIAPDALTYAVKTWFQLEDYDQCVALFLKHKDLVGRAQANIEAFLFAADAYSQKNEIDKALLLLDEAFNKASLMDEDKRRVYLKKAEILIHGGQFQESLDFIDANLTVIGKDTQEVFFLKAESYYALKNFEMAKAGYLQLLSLYPDSKYVGSASMGLAYTYKALEDDQNAFKQFVAVLDSGASKEKRAKAHYNAIIMATNQNRFDEAVRLAEQYINTYKDSERGEDVAFMLGTMYGKNKQYEKAYGQFEQFITQYPQSKKLNEARFFYAYHLQLDEKFEKALEAYYLITDSEAERTTYLLSLKNMALIYVTLKNEGQAAEIFRKLILDYKSKDFDANTFLWLAKKYLDENKFQEVIDIIAQSDLSNWNAQDINGLNFFKAKSYLGLADYAKAIEIFNQIIESKEQNAYVASAFISKAQCLKELKQYDEAITVLEDALSIYAQDNTVAMQARYELGECEKIKGNEEEASKYFMLVALLYDDQNYVPKALFNSGEIFESLKKKDQAIQVYQELIDRFKENKLSLKAQERVTDLSAR